MNGMAWLAASAVLAVVPVGVLAVLVLAGALAHHFTPEASE